MALTMYERMSNRAQQSMAPRDAMIEESTVVQCLLDEDTHILKLNISPKKQEQIHNVFQLRTSSAYTLRHRNDQQNHGKTS